MLVVCTVLAARDYHVSTFSVYLAGSAAISNNRLHPGSDIQTDRGRAVVPVQSGQGYLIFVRPQIVVNNRAFVILTTSNPL